MRGLHQHCLIFMFAGTALISFVISSSCSNFVCMLVDWLPLYPLLNLATFSNDEYENRLTLLMGDDECTNDNARSAVREYRFLF